MSDAAQKARSGEKKEDLDLTTSRLSLPLDREVESLLRSIWKSRRSVRPYGNRILISCSGAKRPTKDKGERPPVPAHDATRYLPDLPKCRLPSRHQNETSETTVHSCNRTRKPNKPNETPTGPRRTENSFVGRRNAPPNAGHQAGQ